MAGGLHYETGRDMPPGMQEQFAVQIVQQLEEAAPTVDAVEVVRCKDCKYSRPTQWYRSSLKCCHKSHGNSQVPYEVPKEHFCSYGERKDDGSV